MHIWAVRFAEHAPVKYHGLAEVAHCKTEEALQTASALWFLDGAGKQREAAIAALRLRWPVLAQKTLVPLDHGMLAQRYERLLGAPGNPSSGWSGVERIPLSVPDVCSTLFPPVTRCMQFASLLKLCLRHLSPQGLQIIAC